MAKRKTKKKIISAAKVTKPTALIWVVLLAIVASVIVLVSKADTGGISFAGANTEREAYQWGGAQSQSPPRIEDAAIRQAGYLALAQVYTLGISAQTAVPDGWQLIRRESIGQGFCCELAEIYYKVMQGDAETGKFGSAPGNGSSASMSMTRMSYWTGVDLTNPVASHQGTYMKGQDVTPQTPLTVTVTAGRENSMIVGMTQQINSDSVWPSGYAKRWDSTGNTAYGDGASKLVRETGTHNLTASVTSNDNTFVLQAVVLNPVAAAGSSTVKEVSNTTTSTPATPSSVPVPTGSSATPTGNSTSSSQQSTTASSSQPDPAIQEVFTQTGQADAVKERTPAPKKNVFQRLWSWVTGLFN